jgi:hypothetical protein
MTAEGSVLRAVADAARKQPSAVRDGICLDFLPALLRRDCALAVGPIRGDTLASCHGLLPPPALRDVAIAASTRGLIAIRWGAILVLPIDQRPHPGMRANHEPDAGSVSRVGHEPE